MNMYGTLNQTSLWRQKSENTFWGQSSTTFLHRNLPKHFFIEIYPKGGGSSECQLISINAGHCQYYDIVWLVALLLNTQREFLTWSFFEIQGIQ